MSEPFNLFASTTPPADELFFKRGDDNDRRLGELVPREAAAYASAEVVILGCPQDEGVRRNHGRPGAAAGPTEIRRAFYRLSPLGLDPQSLFDIGDTRVQATLEETHSLHFQIVRQLLSAGKQVIVLGGGNDISYPDCCALAEVAPELLAFNVDAHFDVRADSVRNSGTPYRQLLEEKIVSPEYFYEMGYQPAVNSPVYHEYLQSRGVVCLTLDALRVAGIADIFREVLNEKPQAAIFWGFDLDAVRAADAPGVSAPSPLGLTADEFCSLTSLAGSMSETRIVEFTEVNPSFDRDNQTSKLVAHGIHHLLAARTQVLHR